MKYRPLAPSRDPYERVKDAIAEYYRKGIETGDWTTYEYWKGYLQGARDQKAWDDKQEEQDT